MTSVVSKRNQSGGESPRKSKGKSDEIPAAAPPNRQTSGSGNGDKKSSEPLLVDQKDKCKSWWRRFWTTWAMIFAFMGVIYVGHPALVLLVMCLQTLMFREVYRLGLIASRENSLPYFKFLPWWWYATGIFFSYGRVLSNEFHIIIPYHSFIAFSMYAAGLCWFVFSLKQPHYKYQFSIFAWSQLTLLIIVMQSSFLIVNMFQGLIWFVMPCLLIISNDIWAYFFGFFWGRTPLIQLSPKKTWEGFLGGFLMTVVTGFFLARVLSWFEHMRCPQYELWTWVVPSCAPALPFQINQYAVPHFLQWALGATVGVMPVQWHGIGLGVFASVIAPFGGFFASGFKRAFKIKDFGDMIPGHGGVTDRMDCQIMMGLFVFVYYSNFVRVVMDENFVFSQFTKLSPDKQVEFYEHVRSFLVTSGMLKV